MIARCQVAPVIHFSQTENILALHQS